MDLANGSDKRIISILTSKNLIYILLIFVAIISANLILFSPLYLLIFVALMLLALLAWKTSALFLILPFLVVSFLPADYIIDFRFKTPLGYLQPIIPLMAIIILIILIKGLVEKNIKINNKLVYLCGTAFYFIYAISFIVNDPTLAGLKKIIYMIFSSIGVILFVNNFIKNEMVERVKWMVVAIGLIISIIGVFEFVIGFNPYGDLYQKFWWKQQSGHLWRVLSLIGNPLVLSAYLTMVLAIALFLFKSKPKLSVFSILILLVAIGLTFSRTAYLAIIIVIFFYLAIEHKKKRNAIIFSGITVLAMHIIILSANIYGIDDVLKDRFFEGGASLSYTHRINAWIVTMKTSEVYSVLVGIGAANLEKAFGDESLMVIKTFDNAFLEIFWESGIFGLISFIVFLVSPCLIRDSQIKRRMLILTIYVIFSFSFATYYFQAIWLTYWFIQSLYLIPENKHILNTSNNFNKI